MSDGAVDFYFLWPFNLLSVSVNLLRNTDENVSSYCTWSDLDHPADSTKPVHQTCPNVQTHPHPVRQFKCSWFCSSTVRTMTNMTFLLVCIQQGTHGEKQIHASLGKAQWSTNEKTISSLANCTSGLRSTGKTKTRKTSYLTATFWSYSIPLSLFLSLTLRNTHPFILLS